MNSLRYEDLEFLRSTERPSYESGDNEVTMVDLFSGCGGMALGIAHAAYLEGRAVRIPLAIDIDRSAVEVFKDNFPGSGCVRGDVSEWFDPAFDARLTNVERETKARVGASIDFLVGGPPCQGNSNLNNHTRRNDSRNALYARMARAARVLEPRIVVIENVPHVINDHGGVVQATKEALEQDDYVVDDAILKLWNMGLPQLRKRHVLLASRDAEFSPKDVLEILQRESQGGVRDLRSGTVTNSFTDFSTGAWGFLISERCWTRISPAVWTVTSVIRGLKDGEAKLSVSPKR